MCTAIGQSSGNARVRGVENFCRKSWINYDRRLLIVFFCARVIHNKASTRGIQCIVSFVNWKGQHFFLVPKQLCLLFSSLLFPPKTLCNGWKFFSTITAWFIETSSRDGIFPTIRMGPSMATELVWLCSRFRYPLLHICCVYSHIWECPTFFAIENPRLTAPQQQQQQQDTSRLNGKSQWRGPRLIISFLRKCF